VKIGRYLKYQRDKRELSLAEFAKLLEVDASFLHRLEKGYYQSVSFDVAEKIAKGLHMNLEDFFTKCGIMPARCVLPTLEFFCKETYQFPDAAIHDLKTFVGFLQVKYKDDIAFMKKKHDAYWKKKRATSK
jgi:transcriptional regulator with XRE-family HTH domain